MNHSVFYLNQPDLCRSSLTVCRLRTSLHFTALQNKVRMKIAAFNAKKLGLTKVRDQMISSHLTKIIRRYSIIFILEVVDRTGKAMEELHRKVNQTGSKEVTLTAWHQYEDNQPGDEDAFAREPCILCFSCPSTAVKDLVLVPVHTKPSDVLKELDELHDVVQAVRTSWKMDNIVILGDFNAGGRYLSKKKMKQIRIRSESYHWLIADSTDTTSSNNNTNCYDRIVLYGQRMLSAIVPRSAKPFNFQKQFKLTDEEALRISDHYPVEVRLKGQQKETSRRKTTAVKKGPIQKRRRTN
ncbi:deoxyribonuclease gamma-like isoform X2 [Echeneis naucrates]|uniref:deoxyribonuclease gamma-like isoform X2 n=1 Tax=Echeneis naucrates TaxID=173247 RepID=UPI0011145D2B|nr:deoxyribonuclease gamma-like isoform X2 [Echeneis naucrates]